MDEHGTSGPQEAHDSDAMQADTHETPETGIAASAARRHNTNPTRKWLISGAVAVAVALGAVGIANALSSNDDSHTNAAASPNTDAATTTTHTQPSINGPGGRQGGQGGFAPPGGFGSEVTGDAARKVEAAVLVKYPGAQFERVLQLQDGSYVAHTFTTDGNEVHVTVDKDFNVTGTETGPGGNGGFGPNGGPGNDGAPGAPATTTTTPAI